MSKEFEQDMYNAALNEMKHVVGQACIDAGHKDAHVIYSAWAYHNFHGHVVPFNNLNIVPYRGSFIVTAPHDDFWGEGEDYRSAVVLKDPTWLDLAVYANEAISVTGDYHHVFFEGVDRIRHPDKDYDELRLCFGS